MAQNDTLTARQQRAIAALLAASTIEQAAEHAGVGRRTLHRWLQSDAFRAALHRAQDEALSQAARRAVAAMTEALQTLQNIAADPLTPPAARVSAAKAVLECGMRLHEIVNLSERVALLEITILKGGKSDEPGKQNQAT